MADINHQIKIKGPQQRVYQALATPSELSKWHTAKIEGNGGVGGVLRIQPQEGPAFEWKVTKDVPLQTIVWHCVKGPGNSAGTNVQFQLSSTVDGRTFVELAHSDWPDTGGNFRKCNTLWAILLDHLRKYTETQKTDPAFA